jgi:hypothetical protein
VKSAIQESDSRIADVLVHVEPAQYSHGRQR